MRGSRDRIGGARGVSRMVAGLAAGAVLSLTGLVLPSAASAAESAGIAQPPEATVAQAYSYQFQDPAHGAVTAAYWTYAYPGCMSTNPKLESGLPDGLSMNNTGLLTGTPKIPEETQFCVDLAFADGTHEEAGITMTVGTGNATLDPTVVPLGTQLALELDNVALEVTILENIIFNDLGYCFPNFAPPYCTL
jgi:hypothetical protein